MSFNEESLGSLSTTAGASPSPSLSNDALDEYEDVSTESFAFDRRMIFQQQQQQQVEDAEDWDVLTKHIDSCVHLDTQFFEYPRIEQLLALRRDDPPFHSDLLKIFLGGMRFELAQSGGVLISWLFEKTAGVVVPESRILIHRRSRNGRPGASTGCASVYVNNESEVQRLLAMNQRIFCGARGIHVSETAEKMSNLIRSRAILDFVNGKVRGPAHPIVIERATSAPVSTVAAAVERSRSASSSQRGGVSPPPPYTPPSSLQGSFARPPPPPPPEVAQYHRFVGDGNVNVRTVGDPATPVDVFVGGLCYEATALFVVWLFAFLDIHLRPEDVNLYVDSMSGTVKGCAHVVMEESDFPKALAFQRRILCDPFGAYIAETPAGIVAVQHAKDRDVSRGPTHAVVIEKRRTQGARGGPPPYAMAVTQMATGWSVGGSLGVTPPKYSKAACSNSPPAYGSPPTGS